MIQKQQFVSLLNITSIQDRNLSKFKRTKKNVYLNGKLSVPPEHNGQLSTVVINNFGPNPIKFN